MTAEPKSAEPTTAEPKSAEPTTAEPKSAEPTTAEPTTAEPTTAEPTTAEPTTAEPTTATIRRYRDSDLAAVYGICVRTAEAGQDARGKYGSDDLMPDLFAGPYVFLEPDVAFVLDDGHQAVGYIVGTPDTAAFARAYRERWIPRLASRYPVPPEPPVTPDEQMLALHYWPERLVWPGLPEYPAHLHIDVLPGFQGAGYGRRLMAAFCDAVAQAARLGCTSASSRITSRPSASTAVSASGRSPSMIRVRSSTSDASSEYANR